MITSGHYIKALPIIYIRPEWDNNNSIQLTGDSAWNAVNRPDSYVPPTEGRPAYLNPTNPHLLLNNNIFGHKWRRTGITGGYYNIDDGLYYSSAGTVSTQAAEFGTAAGNTSYLIDHHTGLGWKWNTQGSTSWSAHTTNAYYLTHAGYSDWFLPNVKQIMSITPFPSPGVTYTTIFAPFNSTGSNKTSTPYLSLGTTQHIFRNGVNFSNRADGTADQAYFCRFHFTGQTGI